MQHNRDHSNTPRSRARVASQASCADAIDDEAITVDDARDTILSDIAPLAETEKLDVYHCLDRVLARDIVSDMDVPACTNSAMDGYAIAGDDLPRTMPREYQVIGTAYAGRPFSDRCRAGQCVRIMTGAILPPGTDTVVMQEHTGMITGGAISIDAGHRKYQNVRQSGEDISAGTTVLERGHHIQPADLGILASIGIGEIEVVRKPKISFFSTGDELRAVGNHLRAGQIYDSNRYSLYGLLSRLSIETYDLGIIRDNVRDLQAAIDTATGRSDMIITTGGVSVGDADYVRQVVEDLGQVHLWKIAMKPGRPVTYGKIGSTTFFGLPGNPVSVMTTFYQFVLPAIQRLSGQVSRLPLIVRATCQSTLKKRAGRFEFQRGILSLNAAGQLNVEATGSQGSGILSSMSRANCLILLDERCDGVEAGDIVNVQPLTTYL